MTEGDKGAIWVSVVLRCIPTHREPRMALAQIAAHAGDALSLDAAEALAITQTAVALLRIFGVLDENDEGIRASGQMPLYFLRSLEWYLRNGATMLDGWRDHRALHEADAGDARGPLLLQRIEQRRLALAQSLGVEALPSREQAAVLVLVKAVIDRKPHFLFQWDARAGQFQLIGGRIEPGETPAQAALREFHEEVADSQTPAWQHARDYALAPLSLKCGALSLTQLSPSYGALTAYTFHVFAARIHAAQFALAEGMCWLNRDDMLGGMTQDGLSIGNPQLYWLLLTNLAGGMRRVPASFAL